MRNEKFFEGIEKDIKELLYGYMKVESFSFSANERLSESTPNSAEPMISRETPWTAK